MFFPTITSITTQGVHVLAEITYRVYSNRTQAKKKRQF